jgi:hypothetical protein
MSENSAVGLHKFHCIYMVNFFRVNVAISGLQAICVEVYFAKTLSFSVERIDWKLFTWGLCPKVFLLTKIKPEYSDILYNLTHFPGSLVCPIRQVPTSCTIWHISLVPWCVRLELSWKTCKRSFAHKYQTFDQNYIQCLIGHTKGPGKCVRLYRNLTHSPGSLVCRIRQVLTSCTIWHISLVPWCVRLDRFWHPVQSDTFLWSLTCLIRHTKGPGKCVRLYRMSEPV